MTAPAVIAMIPNALRDASSMHPHQEVRTLLNVICDRARKPDGTRPTVEGIAALMGYSYHAVESWMRTPMRNAPRPGKSSAISGRTAPYLAIYALRLMAANPQAVADELWPSA